MRNSITTRDPPERRMRETLFHRHRHTLEPMRIAGENNAALQAIHTKAVIKVANSQENNVVLDDRPPPANDTEKDLIRNVRPSLNLDQDIADC